MLSVLKVLATKLNSAPGQATSDDTTADNHALHWLYDLFPAKRKQSNRVN